MRDNNNTLCIYNNKQRLVPWIQEIDQAYRSGHGHRHLGGDDPWDQLEAILDATNAYFHYQSPRTSSICSSLQEPQR